MGSFPKANHKKIVTIEMIKKLFIANRAEIACRIMSTCRRLGIRTVVGYSDADAHAAHVRQADEAVRLGAGAPRDSYLAIEKIIQAAKSTGADAVHPGYGFLSEKAEFAEACIDAGLTFVGPPASAIRIMGEKHQAKALMSKSKVPVLPGYEGEDQTESTLLSEAERIGWPILIKAVAGGGGRGMRRVDSQAGFSTALAGAQREATTAFGDGRVLLEKFLPVARHIEIQIFSDMHGNTVHLFERECTIQRRYQKIIEEAPAVGMTESMREAMTSAAIRAADAVGYVGAGTVEFIVDASQAFDKHPFYFMEMNTRLQVEHPVTEKITGFDLVEWQLKVATGQPLPVRQKDIQRNGHAIEARICAEDPSRNFLPSPGHLSRLRHAVGTPHIRVDTGYYEGDTLSTFYDALLAKVIAHSETRGQAIAEMDRALADYEIAGVNHNAAFLRSIVGHKAFRAGDLDTAFIDRFGSDLNIDKETFSSILLPTAALHVAARLGAENGEFSLAQRAGQDISVQFRRTADILEVLLPGGSTAARLRYESEGYMHVDTDIAAWRAAIVESKDSITVIHGGASVRFNVTTSAASPS